MKFSLALGLVVATFGFKQANAAQARPGDGRPVRPPSVTPLAPLAPKLPGALAPISLPTGGAVVSPEASHQLNSIAQSVEPARAFDGAALSKEQLDGIVVAQGPAIRAVRGVSSLAVSAAEGAPPRLIVGIDPSQSPMSIKKSVERVAPEIRTASSQVDYRAATAAPLAAAAQASAPLAASSPANSMDPVGIFKLATRDGGQIDARTLDRLKNHPKVRIVSSDGTGMVVEAPRSVLRSYPMLVPTALAAGKLKIAGATAGKNESTRGLVDATFFGERAVMNAHAAKFGVKPEQLSSRHASFVVISFKEEGEKAIFALILRNSTGRTLGQFELAISKANRSVESKILSSPADISPVTRSPLAVTKAGTGEIRGAAYAYRGVAPAADEAIAKRLGEASAGVVEVEGYFSQEGDQLVLIVLKIF
jgi:hypothetical protein